MAKSKRECGYCHTVGHNSRTCPKKRGDAARLAGRVKARAERESTADLSSAPVLPPTTHVTEFTESTQQIEADGNIFRLTTRTDSRGKATALFGTCPRNGTLVESPITAAAAQKMIAMLQRIVQVAAVRVSAVKSAPQAPAVLPPADSGFGESAEAP